MSTLSSSSSSSAYSSASLSSTASTDTLLDQVIQSIHDILLLYTTPVLSCTDVLPLPLQPILESFQAVFGIPILPTSPPSIKKKEEDNHRPPPVSVDPSSSSSSSSTTSSSIGSLAISVSQFYSLILYTRRLLWDILHSGKWMEISIHFRIWYLLCSCYETVYLLTKHHTKEENTSTVSDGTGIFIKKAIECLDIGFMLGPSPPPSSSSSSSTLSEPFHSSELDSSFRSLRSLLVAVFTSSSSTMNTHSTPVVSVIVIHLYTLANHLMTILTEHSKLIFIVPTNDDDSDTMLRIPLPSSLSLPLSSSSSSSSSLLPIPRLHRPSLTDFYHNYMVPNQPVILTGILDTWPAYDTTHPHYWGNLHYLRSMYGLRTVPIELGKHYMDKDWSTKLITFDQFIRTYINSSGMMKNDDKEKEGKGYLAQFPLFDHIPLLKKDIRIPDYCGLIVEGNNDTTNTSTTTNRSSTIVPPSYTAIDPQILAWFGPSSTVSNLHYDRPYNLLSQVIGYKRIRLYHPQYSYALYPYEGLMTNTSPINPEVYDTIVTTSTTEWTRDKDENRVRTKEEEEEKEQEPPLKQLRKTETKEKEETSRSSSSSSEILNTERMQQETQYPLFHPSIPHYDFVLQPGEILYIPPYYWHHVRSLSVSFSVSFWWE